MDVRDLPPIFDRLAGPLRLFARQWLDPQAAEDAVQEAFVRLLGQRSPPDDVAAWLFTTVRRLAIDAHRRQTTRDRYLPKLAAEDFEAADPLELEAAVAALGDLNERQRATVIARLWGGLDFAAIGDLMGVSAATAHGDYHAALEVLRRRLDPEHDDEKS